MSLFIYNEEYIDLGEIGEHELQITAMIQYEPFLAVQPSISIMGATALISLGGKITSLDVTEKIRGNSEWEDRIRVVYEGQRDEEWEAI